MIRINRKGLSERELASVRRPLADNGGLDIHVLGENLSEAIDKYMDVFIEAVDSLDRTNGQS
jgi:hypothetical protein